jgi:hypothetical protein
MEHSTAQFKGSGSCEVAECLQHDPGFMDVSSRSAVRWYSCSHTLPAACRFRVYCCAIAPAHQRQCMGCYYVVAQQ